jgi:ribonucrease Y
MEWAIVAVVALAVGVVAGLFMRRMMVAKSVNTAEVRAAKLVSDAEHEAEVKVQQALLEVRDEISGMRREADEDVRVRREELRRNEERLAKREEQADTHLAEVDKREKDLERIARELQSMRQDIERAGSQARRELERVSQMTVTEAKEALARQVVDEAKRDAMATVREIEQQAREEGEKRARKIVTVAIQRVASELTSESTVSVFPLPSDDMKGRIIGREGRNIRTFEALTGVNLIIDDTPEAVVLSSFDPVRRGGPPDPGEARVRRADSPGPDRGDPRAGEGGHRGADQACG